MSVKKRENDLQTVVKKINSNAKDVRLMERLLSEYKLALVESLHKPTIAHLEKKDVVKHFDSKTFTMGICNDGTAYHKVYGGLTIIANPNIISFTKKIESIIDADVNAMSKEEKELHELDFSAFTYIMTLLSYIFSDVELAYNVATECVNYQLRQQEQFDEIKESIVPDQTKEDLEFLESMQQMDEELNTINEYLSEKEAENERED